MPYFTSFHSLKPLFGLIYFVHISHELISFIKKNNKQLIIKLKFCVVIVVHSNFIINIMTDEDYLILSRDIIIMQSSISRGVEYNAWKNGFAFSSKYEKLSQCLRRWPNINQTFVVDIRVRNQVVGYETSTQCWFNVGPASQTVGQH